MAVLPHLITSTAMQMFILVENTGTSTCTLPVHHLVLMYRGLDVAVKYTIICTYMTYIHNTHTVAVMLALICILGHGRSGSGVDV